MHPKREGFLWQRDKEMPASGINKRRRDRPGAEPISIRLYYRSDRTRRMLTAQQLPVFNYRAEVNLQNRPGTPFSHYGYAPDPGRRTG